ncbi:hypothetical protein ILYODFUR_032560 [Ilyodon furcidens]|uniref:Uncharacterized protein n=1 Tax=Ilyodon furcidens TaxID=33524 RepID=A0ABV0ULD9_9TELE
MEVLCSTPSQVFLHGDCMFFLHALPLHAWVLTGYSRFLPQSKNMTVRLIDLSTLPLGVNECVHGCLSCVCLCCPAMDWRPLQGVPCLPPIDCCHQLPHGPLWKKR